MSKTIEEIRNLLRGIGDAGKYEIWDGVVEKVKESERQIDVRIDEDIVLHDIKLRAVSNGYADGIVCIPKKGSRVVFAMVRGSSDYVLIKASELDKVIIETGVKVELKAPETVFNNGDIGLPLSDKVTQQLNKIEQDLIMLKGILTGWAPGASGAAALEPYAAALGTAIAAYAAQPIQPTVLSQIASTKIKQ